MNEIFLGNLRLISNAVLWFSNFFGINTPEFTEALTEEPMMAAYDKIMGIAQLASLAAACGLKPDDFQQ